MKKRLFILFFILAALCAFPLVGCESASQYDVEFYDGDTLISTLGTTAQSLVIPDAPEKEGYDFDGWYLDKGEWEKPFTVAALTKIPLTSKTVVKVYAHYVEKDLPVSLDGFTLKDGVFYITVRNAVASFDFADAADAEDLEWSLSYTASGEKIETAVDLEEGDNLFYITVRLGQVQASYPVCVRRRPMYTVSFDTDGGSTIGAISVEEGESPDLKELVPQKTGYVFSHWSGNADPVTAPVTLKAVYNGKSYTVRLDPAGGNLADDTVTAVFGKPLALPVPEMTGYTFVGWYRGDELFDGKTYDVADDIGLTAEYTPTKYTISYELRGGQNAQNATSYTVESDDIPLAAATRNGAVFDGWYSDSAYKNKVETIASGSTGDVTLYAKWKLISYKITYHTNGGELNADDNNATAYNVETFALLGGANRPDYTFSGWYADDKLGGQRVERIVPGTTGDLDLYAKWQYGTEGLSYASDGNGGYKVIGYNGALSRVVIPATMDGFNVTAIDRYAFSTDTTVNEVEICDGVKTIGGGAFWQSSLQTLSVPASVTEIGDGAFNYCRGLKNVYYNAAEVKDLTSTSRIFGTSSFTENAFDITIGKAVRVLPAFFACDSGARSVSFEQDCVLTRIGEYALAYTGNNNRLILPDGLKTIDKRAFAGARYSEIALPNGLKTINEGAFASCTYLQELVIPDTVATVGVDILESSPSVIIRVVAKAKGDYWQTNWNASRNIVVFDCLNNDRAEDGKIYAFHEGALYSIEDGGATLANMPSGTTTVVIPDSITYKGADVHVTSIADGVFKGKKVREVTLPSYLTEIPERMFDSCGELQTVTALGNVTTVGNYAFAYCDSLTTLIGFENVNSLGNSAFYSCDELKSVSFPEVTVVASSAFSSCDGLQSATFSPKLTEICDSAFWGCSSLHELTFPDTLTKIGSTAFRGAGILHAELPDGLVELGTWAFLESYLMSVHIPSSLESIPDYAFGKTRIAWVDIPDNIKIIDDSAFSGCYNLAEVVLHDGLTQIERSAFNECGRLKKINLPSTLIDIGSRAFYYCTALDGISLPASLTTIGSEAFYNCTSLDSLILHTTVTKILKDAFKNCSSLSLFTDASWYVSDWSIDSSVKIFYNCRFSQDGDHVIGIQRNSPSYGYSLNGVVPPERDGYTFGGWFLNPEDDGTRVTDLYGLTLGTDVFARWIPA